ncbi:MAG: c-type cytochrome [Blastocatellia bacterium]
MRRCVTMLWVVLMALLLAACEESETIKRAAELTGGDPERGRAKIQYYGCGACHTIPGVDGAQALVGPELTHFASRVYVAGVLPNSPENVVRWIRNPKQVDQLTAMPNLDVSEADARDIAGYLYTLK